MEKLNQIDICDHVWLVMNELDKAYQGWCKENDLQEDHAQSFKMFKNQFLKKEDVKKSEHPLFKLRDWFFVVSWKMQNQTCSADVLSETEARRLFADLKETNNAQLFKRYRNGCLAKIA